MYTSVVLIEDGHAYYHRCDRVSLSKQYSLIVLRLPHIVLGSWGSPFIQNKLFKSLPQLFAQQSWPSGDNRHLLLWWLMHGCTLSHL